MIWIVFAQLIEIERGIEKRIFFTAAVCSGKIG